MHDNQELDDLIEKDDRVVYADSAYAGVPKEAAFAAKNVEPQINPDSEVRQLF